MVSIILSIISWARQSVEAPDNIPSTPLPPSTQEQKKVETEPTKTMPIEIPATQREHFAKVIRVIDGDTIVLEGGKHVRLIGIDTPELRPRNGEGVQCFSGEAAQRTVELTFQKEVRLERDKSETDRYGRLLRYVYVGDIFINKTLVEEGFAKARAYKPDTSKQGELAHAMEKAQKEMLGLWKTCPQ
jgi:micrococcal nuclease